MKTTARHSIQPTIPSTLMRPEPPPTPPLAPILAILAVISLLLTITVGGLLFFAPDLIQARWVWPLKPYNTRFLGAFYLTAAVGFASLLFNRRGSLARLIVPMFFLFTANALMVCCLQLQVFDALRRATDVWFWLYLADCIGGAYYFAHYRQQAFAGLRRLPGLWPIVLGLQAGLLGAYGLSMLFFPAKTGSGWLWPLDVFHSQLYSSIFLAGAVGSALLARRAAASEARSLGSIQVVFSVFVALGVWIVDKDVQGIDWSLPLSWVWLGVIALLGLVGLGLIRLGRSVKVTQQAVGE